MNRDDFKFFDDMRTLWAQSANQREGSLKYIDSEATRRGVEAVTLGRSVSIARIIDPASSDDGRDGLPRVAVSRHTRSDGRVTMAYDRASLWCHGLKVTHLDGPNHIGVDGMWYPNGTVDDREAVFTEWIRRGFVTRCVLLDIPAYRGEPFVDPSAPVTFDELCAVERSLGFEVMPGDAVLLYCGQDAMPESARIYSVVGKDTCPWFIERSISVLCWDLSDAPNASAEDMGPHFLIWAVGLALVDHCDFGQVVSIMRAESRSGGLLCVAPQPVLGTTGCIINPIVVV
jgi:hypothetical protein